MDGEWELLMDEVQAQLSVPPKAIYLPSKITGATKIDTDMLKLLWQALNTSGIPMFPPRGS